MITGGDTLQQMGAFVAPTAVMFAQLVHRGCILGEQRLVWRDLLLSDWLNFQGRCREDDQGNVAHIETRFQISLHNQDIEKRGQVPFPLIETWPATKRENVRVHGIVRHFTLQNSNYTPLAYQFTYLNRVNRRIAIAVPMEYPLQRLLAWH